MRRAVYALLLVSTACFEDQTPEDGSGATGGDATAGATVGETGPGDTGTTSTTNPSTGDATGDGADDDTSSDGSDSGDPPAWPPMVEWEYIFDATAPQLSGAVMDIAGTGGQTILVSGQVGTASSGLDVWWARLSNGSPTTQFPWDGPAARDDFGTSILFRSDRIFAGVFFEAAGTDNYDPRVFELDPDTLAPNEIAGVNAVNGLHQLWDLKEVSNELVMVGTKPNTEVPTQNDFWIAKVEFNGGGYEQSLRDYAGGNDVAFGAVVDGTVVYVVGIAETGDQTGVFNTWLVKIGADLLPILEVTMPEEIRGIGLGSSGSLYLAGRTPGSSGDGDAFLARYDSNLEFVWSSEYASDNGPDAANAVAFGPGGILVAGSVASSNGDADIWFAQYDEDGNLMGSFLREDAVGDDQANAVQWIGNGTFAVGGAVATEQGGSTPWVGVYQL